MAILALYTGATGLNAQSLNIDTIANNIANVTTNGYKAQRMAFEDLIYQNMQQVGETDQGGAPTPVQIGLGVRPNSTTRIFTMGPLTETGRQFDVAVQGRGFFRVELPDSMGGGTGYKRDGEFFVNADGVLVDANGYRLSDGITIPQNATSVTIQTDGQVIANLAGGGTAGAGQIQLTDFINLNGLEAVGQNIFVETDASGDPIGPNQPGTGSVGTLRQGFLEGSNVEVVTEVVRLIQAQRAFDFNSQSVQAADEALQVVANLRR